MTNGMMERKGMKAVLRKGLAAGLLVGALLGAVSLDARADEPSVAPTAAGVVNINTATAQQLGLLPGIGEAKAQAIIQYRTRRPFARVEDIVAVRGIGRATLRRLRPYLAVRGETTLTRPVARPRSPAQLGSAGSGSTAGRAPATGRR
jgi:competence protein ComEA